MQINNYANKIIMKELKQYINKADIIAEIEKRIKETESMQPKFDQFWAGQISAFKGVLKILDNIEVKETEVELENENNNITVGTKIRLKTKPDVILSIISNDCHEDEFECSNGSVLSLQQIEKYYDIYEET